MSKREEFWCLLDATKPDIIFGCETWLKPTITNGELFPPEYNVYRKDRDDGYGGVLLGIHSTLNSHQLDIQTQAEFVAVKIVTDRQPVIIGSLYRPPYNNHDYMTELNRTIVDLCQTNKNAAIWIAGDANLPDINWSIDQVNPKNYTREISESFLQTLARSGLEQTVTFPTRGDNTLDIIITNRPTLTNRCECAPGLSDHDIIFLDTYIKAPRKKPVRRKILLWKHANWDKIHKGVVSFTDYFLQEHSTLTPVELLVNELQKELVTILEKYVPSKLCSGRCNQPWFNTLTKRMSRKKGRAHMKARRTNRDRDWTRYRRLKTETQRVCRQAYNKHIADIVGSEPGGKKRLGAIVKSKRCDQLGVSA